MKKLWAQQAARFEALNLRERLFIIITVIAAVVVFSYVGLIEPQLTQQKIAERQVAQQATELTDLRQKVVTTQSGAKNQDAANLANLQKTKEQIGQTNDQLTIITQTLVAPDKVAGLLDEMLKRNHRLQLLSLRNLPASSLIKQKEEAVKERIDPAVAQAMNVLKKQGVHPDKERNNSELNRSAIEGPLYKHGVEITVVGSYADLLAYLVELEKMPQRVLWNSVKLSVEDYPRARLTLTVYTLSLDKTWLTV
ncbi:MAG: type II secretion system protein GspM [Pseudomonadota bacterium]